jgi:HEAT repeat protein
MSQMTEWADFRQVAFGDPYMVWHDGPDFADFGDRVRADRAGTTTLVLAGLAEGDALAAQAIGEAGMTELVPQLTAALEHSNGTYRVRIAESLLKLTGEQSWASAIADVLLSKINFWSDRLDAAMALGRVIPRPALIEALAQGMQDAEYLVRYHSSNSLLVYGGRSADVYSDSDLFDLITDGSTPAQHAKAAAQLAAAATAELAKRPLN